MTFLEKLKSIAKNLQHEIKVYQLVLRDRRTPKLSKILLSIAIAYTLLPFDIIPDFIPIIGHIDDLIIVPALIYLAFIMIPPYIIADCRAQLSQSNSISYSKRLDV